MSETRSLKGLYSGEQAVADLLVVGVIAVWWLTARAMPADVFPSVAKVGQAFLGLATTGEFWANAGTTALRIFGAVCIATFLGTLLGLLPRYIRWTGGIVDNILVPFFSSFPGIAWAILGTIWFGVTSQAVLFVQVLIILPFALVNVAEGAKAIGTEEVEMARSFTRNRWTVFWRVELPLISPFIIASVRIAYGVCWKISLIAELFGAQSGIGYLMQLSQDVGAVDRILAICLWIVVFVMIGERLIIDRIANFLDRAGGPPKRPARRLSFLSKG
ncbi:sulfonate transport system permease protein [Xaviernesmea oryzae]|uniref:Sulfonate transport system permease protein n=1 Tax=Xaviernesmea oryzae TaxID=464029 RepID=A0A1X7G2V6_9HYPH|nr:ABC transporter permease subunit [Xaviernesmea oryzae]SMF62464.1 sulfonate transport system permease protein [Xaviernesmea oryzae]